jgi:hypothetical protein
VGQSETKSCFAEMTASPSKADILLRQGGVSLVP